MLRIALLGMGEIAHCYADAITVDTNAELVAACDLEGPALRAVRAQGLLTTTDYRELVSAPEVDAVIVCTPNFLHAVMCEAALLAGKHVCCEKPLVLDAAEANALAQLARSRQRVLFTAFHRRYNRNVRALRDSLQGRRVLDTGGTHDKRIVGARVRYFERIEDHCQGDRWYLDPRRSGGGALADNGPNALDVAELLVGPIALDSAEIERDTADGVDYRARVHLTTPFGACVACELDWVYPHGELKDVTVELANGRTLRADMLAGFPAFKSSLQHEYRRIVGDFVGAIRREPHEGGRGADIVALVGEAYRIAREVPRISFDVA